MKIIVAQPGPRMFYRPLEGVGAYSYELSANGRQHAEHLRDFFDQANLYSLNTSDAGDCRQATATIKQGRTTAKRYFWHELREGPLQGSPETEDAELYRRSHLTKFLSQLALYTSELELPSEPETTVAVICGMYTMRTLGMLLDPNPPATLPRLQGPTSLMELQFNPALSEVTV